MSTFVTWLFAGIGVALGSAVPSLVSRVLSWTRRAGGWLVDLIQPAERYNSLNLANWEVEVMGQREKSR